LFVFILTKYCFYLSSIVKLDAIAGYSEFCKVFKVTNIKTNEIKALKAIPIMDNSGMENSEEFKNGMEIGRKCEYLVNYDEIFIEGNFEIIIMDYFEKGDLQYFLNKGNKLKELVYTFFNHFIITFFVINRK
jgi:serine/threonine protein kinase